MSSLNYKGQIVFIGKTDKVSEKFQKRILVLSDKSSTYPQEICFELHQDKCDLLNSYSIGDEIQVNYNLNGKLWKNNKWFNTLVVYKIDGVTNNF